MPLLHRQFLERLAALTDAELLCDMLHLTSEDIIEAFPEALEEHMSVLKDTFDLNLEVNFFDLSGPEWDDDHEWYGEEKEED